MMKALLRHPINLLNIVALLFVFALAGGCSILGEPVAEKVADVIDKYCQEPFGQRQVYRETVNSELAAEGHSVEVTCAGDPLPVPETRLDSGDARSNTLTNARAGPTRKPEA